MVSDDHSSLKVLFFPFMAQGHMLPMVDMAKLFAARGVNATIMTTPANAALIRPSIESSRHPIGLHLVPLPSVPGLPAGCENVSSIASPELKHKFLSSLSALRDPFDCALTELSPDCVVTDMFLPWTADVAAEHGVPRVVFHGSNFFASCAFHSLQEHKPHESLPPEVDSFILPGLPHEIRMLKSQIDQSAAADPARAELLKKVRESESKSYGTVMNSFYELEPDYVLHYRNVLARKAWHIGPVSLCNGSAADKSARWGEWSMESEICANWLDRRSPGSVVYVCFGSMGDFSAAQIRELASGLEASNRPFVWVVRLQNGDSLPEGFEERTRERGLIIRGWAPQILILNHESVGCFVTHCGWNSSLEGISAGQPLVTWPLFAEQFYNEKLIVDLLKIGVAVGVKVHARGPDERELVPAATITDVVSRVMGGGEAADERRRRAKELGATARKAVEEGGSSYVDMGNLMQELIDKRSKV